MTKSSYEVPVLDTYHAVVLAFSDFLTVAIHTILYERDIYPRTSFLSARKYNLPVKQSRHPKVCQWIQDAVAAVEVEMLKVGCYLLLRFSHCGFTYWFAGAAFLGTLEFSYTALQRQLF